MSINFCFLFTCYSVFYYKGFCPQRVGGNYFTSQNMPNSIQTNTIVIEGISKVCCKGYKHHDEQQSPKLTFNEHLLRARHYAKHFTLSDLTPTATLRNKVSETGKASIGAACHYRNQWAETGIKSSWALYSDGQHLRRQCIMYPSRPSYISYQASLFIRRKKCRKGFGIQERG